MPGQSMRFRHATCRIALRPTPHQLGTEAVRHASYKLHTLQVTVALVIREYDNSKRCSSLVQLIHGTRSSGGGMCRDASPD